MTDERPRDSDESRTAADEPYRLVDPAEAERSISGKSETEHVDLTSGLALAEMRARVWYLDPGHERKGMHVHETQEELYVVLGGGGRITVGGDTHTLPVGAAVSVPPETPRRLFNDTDEEHVWLVVGAPPVPQDGRRLD